MSITQRTLKDGSTVYVVREYVGFTIDGKRDREKITCKSLKDAKIEQARMVAMRDARRNRSGRCTFSDYVDRWYWPSTAALAPTSRDTYRREIDKRLKPALAEVDIRDIDRLRIQRIVDGCATLDVARKCVGVLKTILNEAKGDGLITSNPAEARYKMPPKGKKRDNGIVITTFAAMRPLIEAVNIYGDECIAKIAMTGLHMGLRPEERYGLDCSDVKTDLGIITIRQAYVSASPQEGGRQLKGTKTDLSTRSVPIPRSLIERIKKWNPPGSSGPFIVGADGQRISPSTAQKRWKAFLRYCKTMDIDVPHVTIENTRHSFATSYLHAGGNIEDLSRILGHSDINTTYKRYVRPDIDDLRRGMDGVF